MPPRYAYWTILIDNAPTAFRAKDQEDLLPTVQQLRRTNKDVTLKWFAHGRIWDSPELAVRPRPPRHDDGVKRGQDWRPGGQHKDPRARFDKTKKKTDRPAYTGEARRPGPDRPRDERRRDDRPRSDRPRQDRAGGDRPQYTAPRGDRPRGEAPRFDRPRSDRPPDSRQREDRPGREGQRFDRPHSQPPRDDRSRRDGPRTDRPPADRPHGKPFAKPHAPNRPWQDRPRPPHAAGGGGERDRRGPGGSSNRRPYSGGAGNRAGGSDPQKPWRPKPQWQPRDNDRSDRPRQGHAKAPAGDRHRPRSADRRPSTERRPADQRPYVPRSDRPREDGRGNPNDRQSGWQRKPGAAGRLPGRRDHAGEREPDKPKDPKTPGGSDSE